MVALENILLEIRSYRNNSSSLYVYLKHILTFKNIFSHCPNYFLLLLIQQKTCTCIYRTCTYMPAEGEFNLPVSGGIFSYMTSCLLKKHLIYQSLGHLFIHDIMPSEEALNLPVSGGIFSYMTSCLLKRHLIYQSLGASFHT